jgi:5-carboxymethyl-2-hydroxymuconate isomerase
MPHAIVEYSGNLAANGDIPRLLEALAAEMRATDGVFPIGGIRVRAVRYDEYVVADGDPENAFVVVTFKIGPGRSDAFKAEFFPRAFDALKAHFADQFDRRPLSLALYVEELDEAGSFKHNNIHQRLKAKASA